jgi:hypothetical protein
LSDRINVQCFIFRLASRTVEALAALELALLFCLLLLAPPVDLSCDVAALELQARKLLLVFFWPLARRLGVIVAYVSAI